MSSGATLHAYGPDADALFGAMEPALREFVANDGSSVTLRYGSADNLGAERVVIRCLSAHGTAVMRLFFGVGRRACSETVDRAIGAT